MAVGRVRMLAKRRRHAGQERSSLARLATLSSDSIVLIEPEASSNSRQCQTIKTETEERRQATLTKPVLNALSAKAVIQGNFFSTKTRLTLFLSKLWKRTLSLNFLL